MTSILKIKLIAIKEFIESALKITPSRIPIPRYFDAGKYLDIFYRYEIIRDALKINFPIYFDDLPIRKKQTSSGTTDFEGRGYVNRADLELLLDDVNYCLNILDHISLNDGSKIQVTSEGIFFQGQVFDAIKYVNEIITKAQNSIILIDGYINTDTLNLFAIKTKNINVKILTKSLDQATSVSAKAFNQQYSNLEIRITEAFHDRFLIIDNIKYYHFGASIKDVGKRAFMFSLIQEPIVISNLKNQIDREWNKAGPQN